MNEKFWILIIQTNLIYVFNKEKLSVISAELFL